MAWIELAVLMPFSSMRWTRKYFFRRWNETKYPHDGVHSKLNMQQANNRWLFPCRTSLDFIYVKPCLLLFAFFKTRLFKNAMILLRFWQFKLKHLYYFNQFINFVYECLLPSKNYTTVLPRIMNFGRIRIPNNIRIFKNDEYEYKYYSEFENFFEYYSWEIFE